MSKKPSNLRIAIENWLITKIDSNRRTQEASSKSSRSFSRDHLEELEYLQDEHSKVWSELYEMIELFIDKLADSVSPDLTVHIEGLGELKIITHHPKSYAHHLVLIQNETYYYFDRVLPNSSFDNDDYDIIIKTATLEQYLLFAERIPEIAKAFKEAQKKQLEIVEQCWKKVSDYSGIKLLKFDDNW